MLSLLVLLVLADLACGGEKQDAITALLRRIQNRLPSNWQVSYDAEYSRLGVRRQEPALIYPAIPSLSLLDTGTVAQIEFAFRCEPYMSPTERRRWQALNEQLEQDTKCLYEELSALGVRWGKGAFEPQREDDKRVVRSYNALIGERRILPRYYFRDISLTWAWPWWTDQPHLTVHDDKIRKECAKVERKVLGQLSKYPARLRNHLQAEKGAQLLMNHARDGQ